MNLKITLIVLNFRGSFNFCLVLKQFFVFNLYKPCLQIYSVSIHVFRKRREKLGYMFYNKNIFFFKSIVSTGSGNHLYPYFSITVSISGSIAPSSLGFYIRIGDYTPGSQMSILPLPPTSITKFTVQLNQLDHHVTVFMFITVLNLITVILWHFSGTY